MPELDPGQFSGGTIPGPLTITGALTVQGAFTSLGIDDNATAEVLDLTDTAVVFNEAGGDVDFRIESNLLSRAFFVDAGADYISMCSDISTQITGLTGAQILDGSIGLSVGADAAARTLTNVTTKFGGIVVPHYTNANRPICLISGYGAVASNEVQIGGNMAGANAVTMTTIYAAANSNTEFGTEVAHFSSSEIVFNDSSGDVDFRVETALNANALVVDAGAETVTSNVGLVIGGGAFSMSGATNAVSAAVATASTNKVAVNVGGTTYYLLMTSIA